MDEHRDEANGQAKKPALTRVMSEQVIGAGVSRRHSSDGPKHKHDSQKSGNGHRDDDKTAKKSHRSSNDGGNNGSPLPVQVNGSSAASPMKPLRRSDSLKEISLATSSRDSPSRIPPRGYQFSLTDDQKKFINETIPKLQNNDPNITTVITKANLPSENFGDFAVAMATNKKVNTLNMSECLYAIPVSVHVARILHENRTIRELNANGNALHTEGIKKIAPELSINNVLTRLFLRNNLITDEGAALIFANLQNNITLQVLDLGKNDLSHQCLPALVETMKTSHTLQELVLDGTNIADEGMILLADAFAPTQNTCLKVLSLQDAKIGPKGFAVFTAAMQTHQSFTKLLLRGNKLKVDRVTAENLFKIVSLQELDLSANSLGEEGVIMLAQGLLNNTTLLHLNLSETLPTTTTTEPINAMRSLAVVLSKNRSLHTLMLVKNGLQDESIEVLMAALAPGKSALQAIDLSGNRITNTGAEHIARMLNHNTQLHELDLSANKIMHVGAKAIIEALKQNKTLRKFIFINASVEPALPQAALEMLKQNYVIQKCLLQKKDEKKITSRIKKAMKAELAYNKKMNFYSYSIKYSRLFEKLSILQEMQAADYVNFQQAIADYFSQTRKIMRFLNKDSAASNLNKQQVVKDIVKEDLARIFGLLNVTSDILKIYTGATEKLQTTYEKLIRDVPAIAPEKPLVFPKPPVSVSSTHVTAGAASASSAEAAFVHVISPRVASVSFGLLSRMDALIVPDAPVQSAAIDQKTYAPIASSVADNANFVGTKRILNTQTLEVLAESFKSNSLVKTDSASERPSLAPPSDDGASLSPTSEKHTHKSPNLGETGLSALDDGEDNNDAHDAEYRLPVSREEQRVAAEITPAISASADGKAIAPAVRKLNIEHQASPPDVPVVADQNDSDSSDTSTSSSSSSSSQSTRSSSISALADYADSGSRLSSASNSRITFTRADPSVVPPLNLPNSDTNDKQKAQPTSASAALPSVSVQAASSFMLFKPAAQIDKRKLQDEGELAQLKELAVDFLVRFMGQLMGSIVNKNVIDNDNKRFLSEFEKQMGIFLCKLFDEFKGHDAPEAKIRHFIAIHNNFKLDDEHIRDLVSIIEIVNAQHFSLLSRQSFQLLEKIFDAAIMESLKKEDEEDLDVVRRKHEHEDQPSMREPRPRLIFFNYLKAIIFEHTLHLFSKTQQWAIGGKSSARSQPLPLSPPPEPPREKEGCVIC